MKTTKEEMKEYIKVRLQEVLEWYKDCDNVKETRDNIRKDANSILKEVQEKFKLRPIEGQFVISVGEDGYVDVFWTDVKYLN